MFLESVHGSIVMNREGADLCRLNRELQTPRVCWAVSGSRSAGRTSRRVAKCRYPCKATREMKVNTAQMLISVQSSIDNKQWVGT